MGFWIELLDEKSHTPSQREGEGEIEDRLHLERSLMLKNLSMCLFREAEQN
jgi:hypothetical protein